MRIFEGQALGALTLLTVSITVYGISLFSARQPVWESPIPWGFQGPGLVAIEIAGDSGKEGIYFLPEGTTIKKVGEITMIPGTDDGGRIEDARIFDGLVLMTSGQGEMRIGKMAAAWKLALGLPVDLNHASERDLSLIPGIGEKMAYQIIQLRKQKGSFRHISDLTAVPGIKEKKLNGLKEYLIAGQTP
jgi:competence ComEA-like helix-hairpin-helix protein